MSLNQVQIIGNIGQEPKITHISTEKTVANFSVATSENYKDPQGTKVTVTEWHNVVTWNDLALIIEKYVSKGSQVYVSGKLKSRSYEGTDKQKHYVTEIIANSIQLLGRKITDNNQNSQSQKTEDNENSKEGKEPF